MRKIEFFCDCCKKQVPSHTHLNDIDVELENGKTFYKEVCFECEEKYNSQVRKIAQGMFGDE